jgi:competence protein ComEA
MPRIVFLLFVCLAVGSCTRRVEYVQPINAPAPGSININTASASELEKLPGIGTKTAEAIVEFRRSNGTFRRAEHLMLIRGVSEERFLRIRPLLRAE